MFRTFSVSVLERLAVARGLVLAARVAAVGLLACPAEANDDNDHGQDRRQYGSGYQGYVRFLLLANVRC